ncbi:hypothetical protein [Hahella ganghwensis]|uniref:hypothetical protein n=1 Tax=Hahella ganghwensis TaxID=286420 RepID=UPI00037A7EDA|nr:hypothetical protein [Hahella ganghwensis]
MTHSEPHELFDSEKYLFAEFRLGCDVEDFLKTDVGRYIVGVAKQEIQESITELLNGQTHAPNESALYKARRAKDAVHWLLQAVERAKVAETQLRDMDNEEGLG